MIKCDNCGDTNPVYFGKRTLCSMCLKEFEKYLRARIAMMNALQKLKK